MRVLVFCDEPGSAPDDPESVAGILGDLGCRVQCRRLDLRDADKDRLALWQPTIAVVAAPENLPAMSGCVRAIGEHRALAEVPLLVVVSLPRLSGLDFSLGFADFILSPVVPAELYARLRQLDWRAASFGAEEVIKVGELVVDVAGYEARVSGRRLDFTHQEFELLKFLVRSRGRVFSRETLLAQVWGYEYAGSTRTVDIHVRRVRAKLGPRLGSLIETVRHVGYKMVASGAVASGALRQQ